MLPLLAPALHRRVATMTTAAAVHQWHGCGVTPATRDSDFVVWIVSSLAMNSVKHV